MTTMTKLTGHEAIEHAKKHGATLSTYADPTEDARTGLTVAEAREIAAEDPSLIYVEVPVTIAQKVAELIDNDGSRFTRDLRASEGQADEDEEGKISLDTIARRHGATVEREAGRTRYLFSDHSSIVDAGGGWDLGISPDCWCWAGAGHRGECESQTSAE